jgi:serine/threonine protein kinase
VCLDAASQTAIKTSYNDDNRRGIEVEKQIYERFEQQGGHYGILQYHSPYDSGIHLELAPNWSLSLYLGKHPEIRVSQRLYWARQVTDALCFVHASNIIHRDLNLNNVLLTKDLDTKLADFGGSSLDCSDLLVIITASYRLPGTLLSNKADIFALGSVHYHIITGKLPYQDLPEQEIKALFKEGKFPETNYLGPSGAVIRKCWQVRYKSVDNVLSEIEGMASNARE